MLLTEEQVIKLEDLIAASADVVSLFEYGVRTEKIRTIADKSCANKFVDAYTEFMNHYTKAGY